MRPGLVYSTKYQHQYNKRASVHYEGSHDATIVTFTQRWSNSQRRGGEAARVAVDVSRGDVDT